MRLGKLLEGALLILHMPIVPHTLPLTSMLHLLSDHGNTMHQVTHLDYIGLQRMALTML
jgi:hypothetical protein